MRLASQVALQRQFSRVDMKVPGRVLVLAHVPVVLMHRHALKTRRRREKGGEGGRGVTTISRADGELAGWGLFFFGGRFCNTMKEPPVL